MNHDDAPKNTFPPRTCPALVTFVFSSELIMSSWPFSGHPELGILKRPKQAPPPKFASSINWTLMSGRPFRGRTKDGRYGFLEYWWRACVSKWIGLSHEEAYLFHLLLTQALQAHDVREAPDDQETIVACETMIWSTKAPARRKQAWNAARLTNYNKLTAYVQLASEKAETCC